MPLFTGIALFFLCGLIFGRGFQSPAHAASAEADAQAQQNQANFQPVNHVYPDKTWLFTGPKPVVVARKFLPVKIFLTGAPPFLALRAFLFQSLYPCARHFSHVLWRTTTITEATLYRILDAEH